MSAVHCLLVTHYQGTAPTVLLRVRERECRVAAISQGLTTAKVLAVWVSSYLQNLQQVQHSYDWFGISVSSIFSISVEITFFMLSIY